MRNVTVALNDVSSDAGIISIACLYSWTFDMGKEKKTRKPRDGLLNLRRSELGPRRSGSPALDQDAQSNQGQRLIPVSSDIHNGRIPSIDFVGKRELEGHRFKLSARASSSPNITLEESTH